MRIIKLLDGVETTGAGATFNLPGWRMALGPIPIQVFTPTGAAFVGSVKLQGSLAGSIWTDISGAVWTSDTWDSMFTKPPYIRAYVTARTSGKISVSIGF